MAQQVEKQIIFDIYEFNSGFMIETSTVDSQNSHDSRKKIVQTLEEVEQYIQKEYLDFYL